MEGVDLSKIANLIYMDDLDYNRWDNTISNPRYKNLVHGLRNSLLYAAKRKQLRGLMKKLFKEFLEELEKNTKEEGRGEGEFLKREIERFLRRHNVEIL